MVQKFKDAANILKAKLKKDDLEQSLVSATSEENWQAPTSLLHQISNAAYNYQKCQQINDFIWDKLKKKTSWRKILKTLNLVEFLIKNGPPSEVSSFKYQIYTFKSLTDYSHFSDSIDRGQAIRERSKAIVQLLSNQQILQEQRTKARTIRQRMSGVTGGHSGDSKYQGYDNKSYKNTNNNYSQSTQGTMKTAYGDYNYNQSTLAKYKDKQTKNTTPTNIPNITGLKIATQQNKPEATQEQNKKPFQKPIPKLGRPGQKTSQTETPNIIGNTGTASSTATQAKQESTAAKKNIMDDDILGFSQPVQTQKQQVAENPASQITQPNLINPMYGTTAPLAAQNVQTQQNPSSQLNFINPMYGTTAPLATQNNQSIQNMNLINPMYGTTAPIAAQSQYPVAGQLNLINPMYGTTAPMAAHSTQTSPQLSLINPMYGTTAPMAAQSQLGAGGMNPMYGGSAQNQSQWGINNNSPYVNINPMYGTTAPMAANTTTISTGISLSTSNNKKDDQFGGFHSGTTSNSNVAWLNEKEKGLIDFSDFGTELTKKDSKSSTGVNNSSKNSNNVNLGWDW